MVHYLLLSDRGGVVYPLRTLEVCFYPAFLFSFFLVNIEKIGLTLRFKPGHGKSMCARTHTLGSVMHFLTLSKQEKINNRHHSSSA